MEIWKAVFSVVDTKDVVFDLRLYALSDTKGIRIRYNGAEYNPFGIHHKFEEEDYLGIRMIYGMAQQVFYQRTFGMNMLQILI